MIIGDEDISSSLHYNFSWIAGTLLLMESWKHGCTHCGIVET